MIKEMLHKTVPAILALALAAGFTLPPTSAEARVYVHVGVGGWGGPYYRPYYGYGYGYYHPYYGYGYYPYYAPPVVYSPPPVVVQPAPTPVVAPQAQTWYYCDNPQGYYPYVQQCSMGWRQVPAQ